MQHDIPTMRKEVIFWADFVLRNKDKSILRDLRGTKTLIQSLPADIFLAIFFTFLAVTLSILLATYLVYRRLYGTQIKEKST